MSAHGSPDAGQAFADPALGYYDPISGLATRTHFLSELAFRVEEARVVGRPLALILMDLERFKAINDGVGPSVGDRLLARVAQRIKSLVPDHSLIGRISGDGFAIAVDDVAEVPSVCAKLVDYFTRPFAIGGNVITLSMNLGVAKLGDTLTDVSSLLHGADLALHRAQQSAEASLFVFEPGLLADARKRHDLETELRSALVMEQYELQHAYRSTQFVLHYQPLLDLESDRLCGFEALIRWVHPTRGLVSPYFFIPIAEEAGLIELLGDWVLHVACRAAASWPSSLKLEVAVNVSPLQLRKGSLLVEGVRSALSDSRLAPERLVLEVTESALVGDATAALAELKDIGCRLSLDDFGSGYSSLSRLRQHPFDMLKVDKSFVEQLEEGTSSPESRSGEWMLRAVASLGRGLDMSVYAKGIERPWQKQLAEELGCTHIQGYLVSQPLPEEAALSFLISRELENEST